MAGVCDGSSVFGVGSCCDTGFGRKLGDYRSGARSSSSRDYSNGAQSRFRCQCLYASSGNSCVSLLVGGNSRRHVGAADAVRCSACNVSSSAQRAFKIISFHEKEGVASFPAALDHHFWSLPALSQNSSAVRGSIRLNNRIEPLTAVKFLNKRYAPHGATILIDTGSPPTGTTSKPRPKRVQSASVRARYLDVE